MSYSAKLMRSCLRLWHAYPSTFCKLFCFWRALLSISSLWFLKNSHLMLIYCFLLGDFVQNNRENSLQGSSYLFIMLWNSFLLRKLSKYLIWPNKTQLPHSWLNGYSFLMALNVLTWLILNSTCCRFQLTT